jgi:hypothetical protein
MLGWEIGGASNNALVRDRRDERWRFNGRAKVTLWPRAEAALGQLGIATDSQLEGGAETYGSRLWNRGDILWRFF